MQYIRVKVVLCKENESVDSWTNRDIGHEFIEYMNDSGLEVAIYDLYSETMDDEEFETMITKEFNKCDYIDMEIL
jgi:predicted fused transcriptional regulator/phosphomethylpyrimidine kinase